MSIICEPTGYPGPKGSVGHFGVQGEKGETGEYGIGGRTGPPGKKTRWIESYLIFDLNICHIYGFPVQVFPDPVEIRGMMALKV